MTPKTIKLIAAGIAIADVIPTLGDKVFALGMPGWVTQSWPFVLLLAYAFDRIGHALLDQPAPVVAPVVVTPPVIVDPAAQKVIPVASLIKST